MMLALLFLTSSNAQELCVFLSASATVSVLPQQSPATSAASSVLELVLQPSGEPQRIQMV